VETNAHEAATARSAASLHPARLFHVERTRYPAPMAKPTARRLLEHGLATGNYDLAAMVIIAGSLDYLNTLEEQYGARLSVLERFTALTHLARSQGTFQPVHAS